MVAVDGLTGLALGTAAFYVDRWGRGWFTVCGHLLQRPENDDRNAVITRGALRTRDRHTANRPG
jgi:hypothetical protein